MKKYIFAFVLCFAAVGFSQIKSNGFDAPDIREGIISHNSNPLFGFLNSENFSMKHSFSMSYSAFGNEGLALGVYTNSMMYRFSDNLNVQLDASIINSPYSTLGKDFQNNINGFYISRAAVNYKPWDDVSISLQYRNLPGYFYNPYYSYGRFGSFMFDRDEFLFGR